MPEETIWKGRSSNWKNFSAFAVFLFSIILAAVLNLAYQVTPWIYLLVAVTAIWALVRWITLRATTYEITSERLVVTRGVFTRVTDTLELYRVRDMQIVQPLLLRMLNLHNISVITTDSTTPHFLLDYIPVGAGLGETFRKAVETCREAKKVRAYDVVSEADHEHEGGAGPGHIG